MRTLNYINVIAGDGWNGWARLSDREARRIGVPRGSIVNPRDPHHVIYHPTRNGYRNTLVRAAVLRYREPRETAL